MVLWQLEIFHSLSVGTDFRLTSKVNFSVERVKPTLKRCTHQKVLSSVTDKKYHWMSWWHLLPWRWHVAYLCHHKAPRTGRLRREAAVEWQGYTATATACKWWKKPHYNQLFFTVSPPLCKLQVTRRGSGPYFKILNLFTAEARFYAMAFSTKKQASVVIGLKHLFSLNP